MKILFPPLLFRLTALALAVASVAFFSTATPVAAMDIRDPETRALEAKNTALELRREAAHLEEKARADGRAVEGELKKYIDLTNKEAEWLEKAAKAWENNQRNLAPKHMERAMELCEKRGPMAAKLHAEEKARELLMEKEKEGRKEFHKKPGDHDKTGGQEKVNAAADVQHKTTDKSGS